MMKGDDLLTGWQKECPICGKRFWAFADWAYAKGYKNKKRYYCSWKCLRKQEAEEDENHQARRAE